MDTNAEAWDTRAERSIRWGIGWFVEHEITPDDLAKLLAEIEQEEREVCALRLAAA